MLYRTEVTRIGEFAAEALSDNMMILFNDNAPADIADYCYIHRITSYNVCYTKLLRIHNVKAF